ncbi:5'/3'-nucleotidase SurE [Nocardia sp. NPDC059240]|uniref:5'/3'-nucleotidase SurE n=1 Tax=Nocardia sp. NPDC059240 TaxID=3346786 RepID=UPI0036A0B3FA
MGPRNTADILLTNDDGYSSIGFYPVLHELSRHHTVCAVAPETQQSLVGKSITAHNHLSVEERLLEDLPILTVSGTPADCVQLGLYHLLERKPAMVVSGINLGVNLGHGYILSSGTIGAAMEAAIDGVRAVAVSMHIPPDPEPRIDLFDRNNFPLYETAAAITAKLVDILLNTELCNGFDLLSVNIPFDATLGTEFEVTTPYRASYGRLFDRADGTFRISLPPARFESTVPGTDAHAVAAGRISITPLSLELLVPQDTLRTLDRQLRNHW